MALDDVVAPDPTEVLKDLIRQRAPELTSGDGSVDPVTMTSRLLRKMQASPQAKASDKPAAFDSTKYGVPADDVGSFDSSDYGEPVEPPQEQPPQEKQPSSDNGQWSGYAPVAGKSLARGAIETTGAAVQGVPALGRAAAEASLSPEGMGGFDTPDIGTQTPEDRQALQARLDEAKKQLPNVADTGIYKAGKAVKDFAKEQFPLTPTEEQSLTSRVARGVGGLVPAVAAGVAGGPEAGVLAAAGLFGASSAGETYDEAKAKGASESAAGLASVLSAGVGAGAGMLDMSAVLAPIKAAGPGWTSLAVKALKEAAKDGVVFSTVGEAQEYLGKKIANLFYDPQANYINPANLDKLTKGTEQEKEEQKDALIRVAANFITGGLFGGIHGLAGGRQQPGAVPEDPRTAAFAEAMEQYLRGRPKQLAGPEGGEPPAAGTAEPPGPEPKGPPEAPKTRAQEDDILRRYGVEDDYKDEGGPERRKQDLADAMDWFQHEAPTQEQPAAEAKAPDDFKVPEMTPEQQNEIIRRHDPRWKDEELAGLSDEQRRGEFEDAVRAGTHVAPEPPAEGTRQAPVEVKTGADIDKAAQVINLDNTHAQGEAGNYQKAHVKWQGLDVTIEAPAGGIRRGINPETNEPFETKVGAAYGYIKGTVGADGQHVDVFMGQHPERNDHAFVLDEGDHEKGTFRQHKLFIGFDSPTEAMQAYLNTSSKKPEHIGGIRMLSADELKNWLKTGDMKEPVSARMTEMLKQGVKPQPTTKTEEPPPVAAAPTPEPTQKHHDAVAKQWRYAGVDPHDHTIITPATLERAAEIMDVEGWSAADANQIAVVREALDTGEITPEQLPQFGYSPENIEAVLDVRVQEAKEAADAVGAERASQRRLRPETQGAAVGGETAAGAGERVHGGSEAGKGGAGGKETEVTEATKGPEPAGRTEPHAAGSKELHAGREPEPTAGTATGSETRGQHLGEPASREPAAEPHREATDDTSATGSEPARAAGGETAGPAKTSRRLKAEIVKESTPTWWNEALSPTGRKHALADLELPPHLAAKSWEELSKPAKAKIEAHWKHINDVKDRLESEKKATKEPKKKEQRANIDLGNYDAIIDLFKKRDASSLQHEMGHQYIKEYVRDAMRPDAPDWLKKEADVLAKLFGADDLADLSLKGISEDNAETFARAHERFLAEGKAPSFTLKRIFEQFAQWMRGVYRKLSDLNVPMSDEFRGFFDRMYGKGRAADLDSKIINDVYKTLRDIGYDNDEAYGNAVLISARYSFLADRLGNKDAYALYKKENIKIRGEKPEVQKEIGKRLGDLGTPVGRSFSQLALAEPESYGPGRREWAIKDEAGKEIGDARIDARDPVHLVVDWVGRKRMGEGKSALSGANSLGEREIRSLLTSIKEKYPLAETVGGLRITGARKQAGIQRGTSVRIRARGSAESALVDMIARKVPPAEIMKYPMLRAAMAEDANAPQTSSLPGYGTPEFKAAREFNFDGEHVVGYDKAIERFVEQAKAYSNRGPVENKGEATVVIGLPGAGKTEVSKRIARAQRSALVDPDDIRRAIPEYKNGRGTKATQRESLELMANGVLPQLARTEANLVIPTTGHDASGLRSVLSGLQAAGYRTSLVHVSADKDEAFRRTVLRFLNGGQIVGKHYFDLVGDNPRKHFAKIKNEDLVNGDAVEIDSNSTGDAERSGDWRFASGHDSTLAGLIRSEQLKQRELRPEAGGKEPEVDRGGAKGEDELRRSFAQERTEEQKEYQRRLYEKAAWEQASGKIDILREDVSRLDRILPALEKDGPDKANGWHELVAQMVRGIARNRSVLPDQLKPERTLTGADQSVVDALHASDDVKTAIDKGDKAAITAAIDEMKRRVDLMIANADDIFNTPSDQPLGTRRSFSQGPAPADLGYYSAVEQAIESIPEAAMTGPQWLSRLWTPETTRTVAVRDQNNRPTGEAKTVTVQASSPFAGIKAEEMERLDLAGWLGQQTGAVSKADVANYVRANNLRLEEVVRGAGYMPEEIKDISDYLEDLRERHTAAEGNIAKRDRLAQAIARIDGILQEALGSQVTTIPTMHDSRRLPGGSNYKEHILTLPGQIESYTPDRVHFTSEGGGTAVGWFRSDERIGPNGEKRLHIAEIQSKRHEAGAAEGYRTSSDQDEIARLEGELAQVHRELAEATKGFLGHNDRRIAASQPGSPLPELDARGERISSALKRLYSAVPDAPFKTTWPELMLKRIIRYASEQRDADGGPKFDEITFDTGETQAERGNLARRISKVSLGASNNPRLPYNLIAYDRAGRTAHTQDLENLAQLEPLIGKDLAQKLIDKAGPDFTHGKPNVELTTPELKMGGEYLRTLYDKRIPAAANKLVKKYGTKVEPSTMTYEDPNSGVYAVYDHRGDMVLDGIEDYDEATREAMRIDGTVDQDPFSPGVVKDAPVHKVAITPELRNARFPLYRAVPAVSPRLRTTIRSSREFLEKNLSDIVRRIVGDDVLVHFDETIPNTTPSAGWGGLSNPTMGGYFHSGGINARDLIAIALYDPDYPDKAGTTFHESWHALENRFIRDDEMDILKREEPLQRKLVDQMLNPTNDAGRRKAIAAMADYEIRATAFQKFTNDRENGGHGAGLSIGVRRIFERLFQLFRQIRNWLQGHGFKSFEDIFEAAARGDMKDRPDRVRTEGISPLQEAVRADNFRDRMRGEIAQSSRQAMAMGPGPVTPPGPRPSTRGQLSLKGKDLTRQVKAFWTSTFQPELVSDKALQAEPLFRQYRAAQASDKDSIVHRSEAEWEHWNKRSTLDNLQMMHDIETGGYRDPAYRMSPEDRAFAREWAARSDRNWAAEQMMGSKAAYVEDYLPHVWKDPAAFRRWASDKSKQVGPTWFQKQRTYDYIEEGRQAGLELKYRNVVDMMTHRLLSGVDMRQRMDLLYKLRQMNVAKKAKEVGAPFAATLRKRGWQDINAPDREAWLLAPDVQPLWQNGVNAKGLWQAEHMGGGLFRGWMALKNAWVPIKLALSAFHPLHVLHINQSHSFARAWKDLASAHDPVAAIGSILDGLSTIPTLGIPAYRKGAKGIAAWKTMPDMRTPEQRAAVQLKQEGGFVPQLSEQLKIQAKRKLQEAWQNILRREATAGNIFGLIPNTLRRGIEKLQGFIFEKWIPALKDNAYMTDAAALLRRRPELLTNDVQRRAALAQIAKNVDSRFGEMFYSNLFWHRGMKDSLIGSFLSLGWQKGFTDQFIAGPVGKVVVGAARPFGKLQGSETRRTIRDADNRLAFAIAYMSSAAMINGAMSYALSGQPPSGLDFIFARVGGENPDGSPRRISNMSYLREIPMLIKHIEERGGNVISGTAEMIWNKLMFEPFHELWNNRNYWGYELWDENGKLYQQAWQAAKHFLGEQTNPITISGAKRALDTGGTATKDVPLAMLGFTPAPAYAEKSAAQNRINYLYGLRNGGTKPEEAGENVQEKFAARSAILLAKKNRDSPALQAAYARGRAVGMSQDTMSKIGQTPTDIYLFSRLPESDQKAVLRDYPDDAKRYLQHAHVKVRQDWNQEHRAP